METLWMIEPWHWLVLGFILLIIEMFVPTFASLWFGAAAIIVLARDSEFFASAPGTPATPL